MQDNSIFPEALDQQYRLWKVLSTRGVTSATDNLFTSIYHKADPQLKEEMEDLALNKGLIWEEQIKAIAVRNKIFNSENYKKLVASNNPEIRRDLLDTIIYKIESFFPEKGNLYLELLEELSVRIVSSEEESALINQRKKLRGGIKQEDFGLRVLSDLTEEALRWKKEDQWAMIQFLRGRGPVTDKIANSFKVVGPERVQRMYNLLPLMARQVMLDGFLDAPKGLLGKFSINSGWGETILEDLFDNKDDKEVQIAKELLDAFLYALEKTNNQALRSNVIAYLLAHHHNQSDSAQVLKNVLEFFGATGVKIGQFLAASGLLPEKITKVLRTLQEKAQIPERESIYEDIREITDQKSLPIRIGNLKGAASMKYAVEIFGDDRMSELQKAILKVFRLSAIAHTPIEFKWLSHMSDRLVKRNGAKYGIFRSIVHASKAAIERELVAADEVKKSMAANQFLYINLNEEGINVTAPVEALINNRAILSQFAKGISFFEIPDELKPLIATKILKMEGDFLFSNSPRMLFDPDRHAGNYRIHVRTYNNQPFLVIEPIVDITAIDMGQLLDLTPKIRSQIVELFAVSQILKDTGPNAGLADKLAKMYNLSGKQRKTLFRQLAKYYPDEKGKEVTAYFAILTALQSAGVKIDIVYFDFIRAIIQLQQYEEFVPKIRNWKTPIETLKEQVTIRTMSILTSLQMTASEKISYAWQKSQGNWISKARALGEMLFSKQKRENFAKSVKNKCEVNLTGLTLQSGAD